MLCYLNRRTFSTASTAQELKEKLAELVSLAVRPRGTTFRVRLAEGKAPLTVSSGWKILRKDGEHYRQIIGKVSSSITTQLKPGDYRVEVEAGAVRSYKDFRVGVKPPENLELVLNAGQVTLSAAQNEGGALLDTARFRVFNLKADAGDLQREIDSTYGKKPTFILEEGSYLIEAEVGAVVVRRNLRVIAGVEFEFPIILGMGQVRLKALERLGGEALKGATFKIFQMNGGGASEPVHVETKHGREPQATLSAGRYRVIASHGSRSVAREIEVFPGNTGIEEFILAGGMHP